jgi:hypothetical protein
MIYLPPPYALLRDELTTSIFALMFRQLALGGDMVSSPFYVDVFYPSNVDNVRTDKIALRYKPILRYTHHLSPRAILTRYPE